MDEDAKSARHQGEDERRHDAAVRDGVLQPRKPSAEDIKQQRHHTQGCDAGARRHDDAGSEERKDLPWSWRFQGSVVVGGLPEVHVALEGKGEDVG